MFSSSLSSLGVVVLWFPAAMQLFHVCEQLAMMTFAVALISSYAQAAPPGEFVFQNVEHFR